MRDTQEYMKDGRVKWWLLLAIGLVLIAIGGLFVLERRAQEGHYVALLTPMMRIVNSSGENIEDVVSAYAQRARAQEANGQLNDQDTLWLHVHERGRPSFQTFQSGGRTIVRVRFHWLFGGEYER